MADKGTMVSRQWQRLSTRERLIIMLTGVIIVSALIYKVPYAMQVKSVRAQKMGVDLAGKQILDLTVQISDLNSRAEDIKAGGPIAVRGRELIDPHGVVLLLDDVSGEARRLGVNLVSVHPSQEVDKENYKEVSMNLDLKARYRELAEYFKRLESLSKVVSVRRIRVESCPDSASVCKAQIEAVAYMAK